MTAEIAILNKSAVALAADSAMTIGNGGNSKIYNTVDKIFELSDTQPLAVMIYGSLEYMGLPFEVITKLYRRERGNNVEFETVSDCANDFIGYLEREVQCTDQTIERHLIQLVASCFIEVGRDIQDAIWGDIYKRGKYLGSKLNGIAQDVIKSRIDELRQKPPGEPFLPGNLPGMLRGYEGKVEDLAHQLFDPILPVRKGTKEELVRLAKYFLHRDQLSSSRTGIVVCGFGSTEICPSLEHIEIDGKIAGKLKRSREVPINIGRESIGADVRAFAQDEMVARFLKGIDPKYEEYIVELAENALNELADKIVGVVAQHANINIPNNAVSPVVNNIFTTLQRKADKRKEQEYMGSILNMVEFMPKQELAKFAESLVDLTSLKRRVSAERETVGGDVDVAVISKSEGLVWIKRKHYFPADLNPRFFERHYGQIAKEGSK